MFYIKKVEDFEVDIDSKQKHHRTGFIVVPKKTDLYFWDVIVFFIAFIIRNTEKVVIGRHL